MGKGGQICLAVYAIILHVCFGIVLPIISITYAAIYHGQCPVQPYVTVYLYVAGVFSLIRSIIAIITQMMLLCGRTCGEGLAYYCVIAIDVLVSLFLFCWLIAGSVWIYQLKNKYSTDSDAPTYCNPELYTAAFAILTTQWVLNTLIGLLRPMSRCVGEEET